MRIRLWLRKAANVTQDAELEKALRNGVFYNPVSYDEKKQIINAFMATMELSGEFYPRIYSFADISSSIT